MHRSLIQFTDYSGGYANFVRRGRKRGDCELSTGCANCYVKRIWVRNPDAWPLETTMYPDKLAQLSRSRPKPGDKPYRRGPDSRPMVFVCDTGDMFHRNVTSEFIWQALDVMYERNDIDWQIVTKRAPRMFKEITFWLKERGLDFVPAWMWLIVSAEDNMTATERLPFLFNIPAKVHGVSCEPLLGPIDFGVDGELSQAMSVWTPRESRFPLDCLDWVIVGGESGAHARPMHPDWARQIRDHCNDMDVAFFMKQMSRRSPIPEDLLIREYPNA